MGYNFSKKCLLSAKTGLTMVKSVKKELHNTKKTDDKRLVVSGLPNG